MPDRKQMTAAIEEYCRAETEKDKDAWLALFADTVKHEDPVGRRTNEGIAKVSEFWDSFQPYDVELWLTAPVIICGNEAIAQMKCKTGPADNRNESGTIIDNFVFDEAGKITRVRAFYDYD